MDRYNDERNHREHKSVTRQQHGHDRYEDSRPRLSHGQDPSTRATEAPHGRHADDHAQHLPAQHDQPDPDSLATSSSAALVNRLAHATVFQQEDRHGEDRVDVGDHEKRAEHAGEQHTQSERQIPTGRVVGQIIVNVMASQQNPIPKPRQHQKRHTQKGQHAQLVEAERQYAKRRGRAALSVFVTGRRRPPQAGSPRSR